MAVGTSPYLQCFVPRVDVLMEGRDRLKVYSASELPHAKQGRVNLCKQGRVNLCKQGRVNLCKQ